MPPRLGILLLTLTASLPWPDPARALRWHTRARSRLEATTWRSPGRRALLDRTEVRQRLTLGIYDLGDDPTDDPRRMHFVADLEMGSDLAPVDADLEALPDGRRTLLDLRYAYLRLSRVPGPLSLTVGRHQRWDAAGWDAVDGATVEVALPYVTLATTAGLAVRRGWAGPGPDFFDPDGQPLDEERGFILGTSMSTVDLEPLRLSAAWRRQARGDDAVQRDVAGVTAEVGPLVGLTLIGGWRHDLIYRRLAEARLGAQLSLSPAWGLGARVRRVRPVFNADSIWGAFGPEPYDEIAADARWSRGAWQVEGEASIRRFRPGPTSEIAEVTPEVDAALDAGGRVTRRFGLPDEGAHLGAEAFVGEGYGGARHYGDVFGQVPLLFERGEPPVHLRGRLGVVALDADLSDRLDGASAWTLLAARWAASETAVLEAIFETHHSRWTPARYRVMGQFILEDWL